MEGDNIFRIILKSKYVSQNLVKEGTIKSAIPELVQMTLEEIMVNDRNHFTVYFSSTGQR